MEFMQ